MSLNARIVKQACLQEGERREMFALHDRFFCHITPDNFLYDLNEKDWVIVLKDLEDQVVGFSTIRLILLSIKEQPHLFLFSGDTIVDRRYWHESKLAGAFGHFMLWMMETYPNLPLYWFLISKGFRTYRFLPLYFHKFYPSCDEKFSELRPILEAVACHKFGKAYDSKSGLICLEGEKDRLRPEMCNVPTGRLNDPHVSYFLRRNPAFFNGDELACLAQISKKNLNRYAWRVIHQTQVDWYPELDAVAYSGL